MEKYINDAMVGNSNILVSLNKRGDILRFYAPQIDYMQHIDEHKMGLVINDTTIQWLNDESIFKHEQYYIQNTNILVTKIFNDNICIIQTDFVDVNIDVLVRKYVVTYNNYGTTNLKILTCSDKVGDLDRFVCGLYNRELDCLMQYAKDSYFVTFSKTKSSGYIVNNAIDRSNSLNYDNREYEGLSKDSAIVYPILLNDNNEFTVEIFIGFRENYVLAKKMVEIVRKIDTKLMYEDTKQFWEKVVSSAKAYVFKNEREAEIYTRSILTFLLYTNNNTGGIIASCEVDEKVEKCGRYAYCWPRDAMYLMMAYNSCGLTEVPKIFYAKFVPNTQSENGMWEQRFYTDTSLGPCWGSQTDQTSSMVIGMINQFNTLPDNNLKDVVRNSIDNGVNYLLNNLDDNAMQHDSYDTWENFYSKSQYTLSSIYCAFKKYIEFNPQSDKVHQINSLLYKIYDNILNCFWREDLQYFAKNINDNVLDVGALGVVFPFEVLNPLDDRVIKTVRAIEEKLTSPVGGIKRFDSDQYIGGNPWIIATLWLCIYYLEKYKLTNDVNDNIKAIEYFDWVTNHSSLHGFLVEQVSKDTGEPIWVNGLAWSHGMYMICVDKIYGK